jgi:SAM-dependent methyltransferase
MRTTDEGSAASTAAAQGELWSARARDWAYLHEHLHTPLYNAAFEAMGIGPHTRLLDAGCGSGVAASLAAARGAHVVGLDAAPAMVAIATTRVPGAEFRVGELENLPFPDDSFSAASAFNSVSYAADPTRALAELGRVVTSGGPVAVATWGQPDACQMRQLFAALAPFLPPPPSGAEGGPFALSAPGRLEQLVASAGLTPGPAAEVTCRFDYPDGETAWRALRRPAPSWPPSGPAATQPSAWQSRKRWGRSGPPPAGCDWRTASATCSAAPNATKLHRPPGQGSHQGSLTISTSDRP